MKDQVPGVFFVPLGVPLFCRPKETPEENTMSGWAYLKLIINNIIYYYWDFHDLEKYFSKSRANPRRTKDKRMS